MFLSVSSAGSTFTDSITAFGDQQLRARSSTSHSFPHRRQQHWSLQSQPKLYSAQRWAGCNAHGARQARQRRRARSRTLRPSISGLAQQPLAHACRPGPHGWRSWASWPASRRASSWRRSPRGYCWTQPQVLRRSRCDGWVKQWCTGLLRAQSPVLCLLKSLWTNVCRTTKLVYEYSKSQGEEGKAVVPQKSCNGQRHQMYQTMRLHTAVPWHLCWTSGRWCERSALRRATLLARRDAARPIRVDGVDLVLRVLVH